MADHVLEVRSEDRYPIRYNPRLERAEIRLLCPDCEDLAVAIEISPASNAEALIEAFTLGHQQLVASGKHKQDEEQHDAR